MLMKETKQLYESLLSDGDLFDLVSGMSGQWEKDKKLFSIYYDQQMAYINDFDIEDETDFS